MFYVIGLGLGDAKDVTVKGLEVIKKCDKVLLESYTSILSVGKEVLVRFINPKKIYLLSCLKMLTEYIFARYYIIDR